MFMLKLLPLIVCFFATLYCWHRCQSEPHPLHGAKWLLLSRAALIATGIYLIVMFLSGCASMLSACAVKVRAGPPGGGAEFYVQCTKEFH